MARLTREKQERLTKEVFRQLQGKILRRQILGNTVLTNPLVHELLEGTVSLDGAEETITNQVAVDALHQLAVDGAATNMGSSVRVIGNDAARCKTLISARLVVETLNVRSLSSSTVPNEALEASEDIHKRMSSGLKAKMSDEERLRFVQDDLLFHESLANAANSPSSKRIITSAYYSLLLSIHTPLPKEKDAQAIVKEHQQLLDEIRACNVDAATGKLVLHLSEAVGRWHDDVTAFINTDFRAVIGKLCDQIDAAKPAHPTKGPHLAKTPQEQAGQSG